MRAVLRPEPEHTPPGIARWPSGSACLVPHGPARAQTISRPRESRTAGLGPFGAAAPFWFPVLRAPGTTPASPVSCTRLGAPNPRSPMQGRSRGSAGVGPGAVGSVGCSCQLQCTCPHGQACAAAWPGLPPTPRGQPARACGPRARGPECCCHGPAAVRVQFILSQGAT